MVQSFLKYEEWWDCSIEAGPKKRPRSDALPTRPTLEVLVWSAEKRLQTLAFAILQVLIHHHFYAFHPCGYGIEGSKFLEQSLGFHLSLPAPMSIARRFHGAR